jgi:lysine 2,3-aminomutase
MPTSEWKQELLQSFTSISDLTKSQLITTTEAAQLNQLGEQFKVRITPYYAGLMSSSPHCPIRKQAIPDLGEADPVLPEWISKLSQQIYGRPTPWNQDAIGDVKNLAAPRITHRYRNRAILHLSSMCAVFCRFCFRKSHLNDSERTLYEGSLDPAFQYLEANSEIRELILTGGDPLSISDLALKKTLERVSQIRNIKTVRIHSRMPVTLPSRFTSDLLEVLGHPWGFNLVIVSHFNHPKELTPAAIQSIKQIKKAGLTLLNQSVLLRGINNSLECLQDLFQGLYEAGVIPFYLHHPDWTPGTFHFRVSVEEGRNLFSHLKGLVPGPALPHYILDIPQGFGKTSLMDNSLVKLEELPSSSHSDPHASGIRGAIYKVSAPSTRKGDQSHYTYLDLFPES